MTYRKLQFSLLGLILGLTLSLKAQVISTPNPGGVWTTPTFASGSYTASAGTWTVTAPNVVTNEYSLIGKTLLFNFNIQNTTVSNAGATLSIALPYTCAKTVFTLIRIKDNGGTQATGMAFCVAAANTLTISVNPAGGGFAISTTNTDAQGQIFLEVQ